MLQIGSLKVKLIFMMVKVSHSRIDKLLAANGHMVQNPPYWRPSYALQNKSSLTGWNRSVRSVLCDHKVQLKSFFLLFPTVCKPNNGMEYII